LEGIANGRYWYFYDHFVNFTIKWYILWIFGTLCGLLVFLSRFGTYVVPRKIWQPWSDVPVTHAPNFIAIYWGQTGSALYLYTTLAITMQINSQASALHCIECSDNDFTFRRTLNLQYKNFFPRRKE
jgi:hypothetical protein